MTYSPWLVPAYREWGKEAKPALAPRGRGRGALAGVGGVVDPGVISEGAAARIGGE